MPHRKRIRWIPAVLALLLSGTLWAADGLPPAPAKFVEDTAGLLSPGTVTALNATLEANEQQTSNQVVVAIYPDLPPDTVLEDYANRTFRAWGVGQKASNNGVVLFIFRDARKMRIEVGYGLEGALPDATAKHILDTVLRPAFRQGDFDGGVTRAVQAILVATRGEYQVPAAPLSPTYPNEHADDGIPFIMILVFGFIMILFIINALRQIRGTAYGPKGRRSVWTAPDWGISSSGGNDSSSWSSGDSGGFSGGGGDSGGGGASGSW